MQIGRLRERFKDEKIHAVYSSDLSRAYVTAAALSEPRGLPIIKTKQLREVDFGVWEDMAWGNLEYFETEKNSLFSMDPARWSVEGSEDFEDVVARMTQYIVEAAKRHDGETIAVFSHGFAIRVFFCRLMGLKSSESRKVLYCDNTAVALLLYDDGELTIEYQSDNSHLDTESSTFAHQSWWRAKQSWTSENLRYMPLDEVRDSELLKSYENEAGERPAAEKEYAAFLTNEPVGLLGISEMPAGDAERLVSQNPQLSEEVKAGKAGWIKYIYLKPDHRRMNFGVQLIGQAVTDFRKHRKELLCLAAPAGSTIVRFCCKYGFEIVCEAEDKSLLLKNIKNW